MLERFASFVVALKGIKSHALGKRKILIR